MQGSPPITHQVGLVSLAVPGIKTGHILRRCSIEADKDIATGIGGRQ